MKSRMDLKNDHFKLNEKDLYSPFNPNFYTKKYTYATKHFENRKVMILLSIVSGLPTSFSSLLSPVSCLPSPILSNKEIFSDAKSRKTILNFSYNKICQ